MKYQKHDQSGIFQNKTRILFGNENALKGDY
eukprot:UN13972